MDTARLKQIRPWQVVVWAAVAVLLVLVILNSRKPSLDVALGNASIPLIVVPIVDLVDQRRKGRSVPRSIGHAVLSFLGSAALLATFYGLAMLLGRPRDVDAFSDSIGPPASYVIVVIVICLAWALVAKELALGPWARKGDP